MRSGRRNLDAAARPSGWITPTSSPSSNGSQADWAPHPGTDGMGHADRDCYPALQALTVAWRTCGSPPRGPVGGTYSQELLPCSPLLSKLGRRPRGQADSPPRTSGGAWSQGLLVLPGTVHCLGSIRWKEQSTPSSPPRRRRPLPTAGQCEHPMEGRYQASYTPIHRL